MERSRFGTRVPGLRARTGATVRHLVVTLLAVAAVLTATIAPASAVTWPTVDDIRSPVLVDRGGTEMTVTLQATCDPAFTGVPTAQIYAAIQLTQVHRGVTVEAIDGRVLDACTGQPQVVTVAVTCADSFVCSTQAGRFRPAGDITVHVSLFAYLCDDAGNCYDNADIDLTETVRARRAAHIHCQHIHHQHPTTHQAAPVGAPEAHPAA